jgi:type I restriction enzyme M protein
LKEMAKLAKTAAGDLVTDLTPTGRLPRGIAKGDMKLRGTLTDPDFAGAARIASMALQAGADEVLSAPIRALAEDGPVMAERLAAIAVRLERHKALEDELKALKADLRAAEKRQEVLVEAARAKITPVEVRDVILERFRRTLINTYRAYLDADRRAVTAAIENLHDKYAVMVGDIENKRAKAATELNRYLKALNYV